MDKTLMQGTGVNEYAPKNLHGDLGPICKYCSGLGFTNVITGGSKGCQRCDQTGIEPVDTRELKKDVDEIKVLLKKIVLELGNKK